MMARRRSTFPYSVPLAYIYLLYDPQSQEPRYVGQTWNPESRFLAHSRAAHDRTRRGQWAAALQRRGLQPIMEIVDVVGSDEIDNAERFWISALNTLGYDLLNATLGGQRGIELPQWRRDDLSAIARERNAR